MSVVVEVRGPNKRALGVMITLAFHPDPAAIEQFRRELGKRKPTKLDAFYLGHDHFYVPVRIQFGGQDLLACNRHAHPRIEDVHGPGPDPFPEGHPACPWMFLPLIHIASAGYLTVKDLPQHGRDEYHVPYGSTLSFDRDGQTVRIRSDMTRALVATEFELLKEQWRRFDRAAAEFIGDAAPELWQHKDVNRWLGGLWPHS
jgi:hypothetical protein